MQNLNDFILLNRNEEQSYFVRLTLGKLDVRVTFLRFQVSSFDRTSMFNGLEICFEIRKIFSIRIEKFLHKVLPIGSSRTVSMELFVQSRSSKCRREICLRLESVCERSERWRKQFFRENFEQKNELWFFQLFCWVSLFFLCRFDFELRL